MTPRKKKVQPVDELITLNSSKFIVFVKCMLFLVSRVASLSLATKSIPGIHMNENTGKGLTVIAENLKTGLLSQSNK